MQPRLSDFVKAYDVRGLVETQLTTAVCAALGNAFGQFAAAREQRGVVIVHDMRPSSPSLATAFADGVRQTGLDVTWAGLGSTDMLYFASGRMQLAGAMFTASHNPAAYNGIKLCLAGAVPISVDTGLGWVRDTAQAICDEVAEPATAATVGSRTECDLLAEYGTFLRSLVDVRGIRPLRVVVDAGNGMAGLTVPAVLGGTDLDICPMYFTLDGSFPNHEANPLDPANLVDLQSAVVREGADLGLAFDGDADRCFVIDERGQPVSPSAVTALVAAGELARHPGGTVLHNLICSDAVAEIIAESGGIPVRTRVGHSFIKAEMARTGAIFGGEHSAHYYFADFFRADTGMLAAMYVLQSLGRSDQVLSELAAKYERYIASGEINSTVTDPATVLNDLRVWAAAHGYRTDELDGLTVRLGAGHWFNVRASNTEPLLRLNCEAPTADGMRELREEILTIIRKDRP